MIPLADTRSADVPASATIPHDEVLVLVQDRLVVSTYAGDQAEAALDLARVLCRALGQPVELYRLPQAATSGLSAGMAAPATDTAWTRFAEVHPTRRGDIEVEIAGADAPPPRSGS